MEVNRALRADGGEASAMCRLASGSEVSPCAGRRVVNDVRLLSYREIGQNPGKMSRILSFLLLYTGIYKENAAWYHTENSKQPRILRMYSCGSEQR